MVYNRSRKGNWKLSSCVVELGKKGKHTARGYLP